MSDDQMIIEIGFKSGSVVRLRLDTWEARFDNLAGEFSGYKYSGLRSGQFSCVPSQIEYWRRVSE